MLSSIGRAAVKRVVAGRPSTNQVFQNIFRQQRISQRNGDEIIAITESLSSLRRLYATAATVTKPRAKKETTRKTDAKAKPAKKAVKKPAKKKAVAKKKPVRKQKAKPKPKPKPKKKVLTPEQKAKLALAKLKQTALLSLPKNKPDTAWSVLLQEFMAGHSKDSSVPPIMSSKDASLKYKSLTSAEKEHYNHIANENKVGNEAALKKWVASYTPDQIREANKARKSLKRRTGTYYRLLPDPRAPTRPLSGYLLFTRERRTSGDFRGIKPSESIKLIAAEWKELPNSERKLYDDRFIADKQRFVQEFETVYNHGV